MAVSVTYSSVSKSFASLRRNRNVWREIFFPTKEKARTVLKDFSLDIRAGEKLLIIGRNGSGKTTLLKMAGGLLAPNSGIISVDGQCPTRFCRSHFGMMLSTQLLYPTMTGYQNLEFTSRIYGCADIHSKIRESIEVWKLSRFVDHLVESYSNGQRALLALARATLHQPKLLLLDEPLAYLDSHHCSTVMNFIKRSESTILLATQQAGSLGGVVDRVVTL